MKHLVNILHEGSYSCVIQNGEIRTFAQRSVADLYRLLNNEPEFLSGAFVADKIAGKAAAALMILGGVKQVYADTVSEPALALLNAANIPTDFSITIPFIQNRDKSGWCPLEAACYDKPVTDILSVLDNFFREIEEKETVKKRFAL